MARYVLDSNIYIEMKNGPYGFDIAPRFWKWIDREAAEGILYSPEAVCRELSSYDDDLALWTRARAGTPLFIEPDEETQRRYREVADYVESRYPPHRVAEFLSGADPWVIAQAWRDGSYVVTHESRVDQGSKKPKIPNICEHFGVEYTKIYDLIRLRGFSLGN
jgi:hypothetical protein